MKLQIIFEDSEILVLNKPAGLVVNRSQTIKEETLQDLLSEYFNLGPSLGIGDRAGIVHRLDRETSGLLLVAKTQKAFENLQDQFKERKVEKEYVCLAHGQANQDLGVIEGDVGRIGKFGKFGIVRKGKESRTDFKVVENYQFKEAKFNQLLYFSSDSSADGESRSLSTSSSLSNLGVEDLNSRQKGSRQSSNDNYFLSKSRINYLKKHATKYTLVALFPKTGRTHQIRVHIKSIGHPAVSDLIYTPKKLLKFDLLWCPRLFLHASSLRFIHPKTKKPVSFKSDLPNDLKGAILNLEIKKP